MHIGKVSLLVSGKIGIQQAEIITGGNDTIFYAGQVKVAFRPLPLLLRRVVIKDVSLHDAVVNLMKDSITGKLNCLSQYCLFLVKPQPKKRNLRTSGK